MAFPRVNKSGMDVPTGPTSHLKSGARGAKKAGGTRPGKKSGLACSPAKMAPGKRY